MLLQAARNHHAMLAARALGRMAGVLTGRLGTPPCTAARQALAALLTPSLAARLVEPDPQDLLQQLNGSVCTPQVRASALQLISFNDTLVKQCCCNCAWCQCHSYSSQTCRHLLEYGLSCHSMP